MSYAVSSTFVLALGLAAFNIAQAVNVNVDIHIGDPGYYGRIDMGDFRHPPLLYPEPRIIYRDVSPRREPVYMRVPPGHAKNWRKHCAKYNACGERVYFVQERWYEQEYVPRYQARRDAHDDYRDKRRADRDEAYRDKARDKHDAKRDKDKGHGKGHNKDD